MQFVLLYNSFVVSVDDFHHAVHAAVTDFYVIAVENFVKCAVFQGNVCLVSNGICWWLRACCRVGNVAVSYFHTPGEPSGETNCVIMELKVANPF